MNKYTLKSLLLVLTLFSLSYQGKSCDVINGSDIIYTHLGGKRYAIKYVLYHQCVCKLSVMPTFTASSGGNSITTGAKRVSIRDITTVCSRDFPPCLNTGGSTGGRYGIEEHIFVDTLDFSKTPYSNWLKTNCTIRLGVQQPWGLIGTTTSTTTYGGIAELNLCKWDSTGNNSPTFSNIPMTFMCCNLPFTFNNGAVDLKDGDSLSFDLANPLDRNFNSVVWLSPWSKKYPLTPYCPPTPGTVDCKPNPNSDPPRGFYFDSMLGDIVMTPTKCSESGPVSIKITEWRKDTAGKWQPLGFTRRDIYVNVIDCGFNLPPTIQATQTHKVCEGDKICFTIKSKDNPFTPYQKTGDTTRLSWSKTISGATFTIKDTTVREREAEFCWQTKHGQARPNPYTFTVKVMDDFCPNPGQSVKGFSIFVKIRAEGKRKYQNLTCGRFVYDVVPASNFPGTPLVKWSFRDSTGVEFAYSTKKSDTMVFKKGQRIIIVHTINTSDNCPTIYRDTWDIPNPPTVILATADTFACFKTGINLEANILYAKLPYKYYWTRPLIHTPGDTLKTLSIPVIDRDSTIQVRVIDGDGCKFYDTATVFVKPLPEKPNIPDQRICTYQKATFDALHQDTMYYLWNTGDTTRTVTKHIAGDYIVTISDTIWGCQMRDTVHLFVNDTVVAIAGADKVICTNDKYDIVGNHKNSALTATYQWTDLKSGTVLGSNKTYQVGPKNTNANGGPAQYFAYDLFVKINQGGLVCEHRDTMVIKVNTLPIVGWSKNPLDPRCHDYGDIVLNTFVTSPLPVLRKAGTFRIWGTTSGYGFKSGNNTNGLVDSQLTDRHIFKTSKIDNNTTLSGGKFLEDNLTVWFKDTNGCVNTASTRQRINGNPIIKLTEKTYCQDKGWAKLDNSVIRPASKFGTQQNWIVLSVPSGVNPSLVLADPSGNGTDWELRFGSSTEDFYAGEYKLKFNVTDLVTGCFSTDTVKVQIITEPTVKVTPPNPVCLNWDSMDLRNYILLNGKLPEINAENQFKIVEYRYDRKDPKINSTKLVNGYMFSPSSGAGAWLLKFSSMETGCLKEDSFYIFVNDTPNASLLSPITLCSGGADLDMDSRISSINPSGAVPVWQGPNVSGKYFKPVSKDSAALEGPYKLRLTVTDNNNCKSRYDYPVTVRSQPRIQITSPNPMQGCERDAFGLKSTSKYTNGIIWTKIHGADGLIDNPSSKDISYQHGNNDSANKYAWLKVTTIAIPGEVCPQVSDSVQIILHTYPAIEMQSPVSGCVPLTGNFTATEKKGIPPGQLTWHWDFGNGNTSSSQNPMGVNFPIQGRYAFTLTVTNTSGPCPTSILRPDYALVYPVPAAFFVTDPKLKTTIALPKFKMDNRSTLDKSVFNSGYMNYHWSFGDPVTNPNDTSTAQNPRYAYGKDTNTYDITLIVTSDKGCKDTFTQQVIVGPDIIVFIPDAFTPDGAGVQRNNTFMISVVNYKSMRMMVFNRWGEKLYETTDPLKGWDGKFRGMECADGVYAYKIEVTSMDDKVFKYDGTVTLLR